MTTETRVPTFWEFFAGGGMARAGLGAHFSCTFANDFDPKKAAAYRANWGDREMREGDVAALTAADLPEGSVDLVWGSFPCQDLSLAGAGKGLTGERSGSFWPFWRLLGEAARAGRPASVVALENVCGTLTSHGGRDFAAIAGVFDDNGYDFGALVIDAERFVPQSRPRLFLVGVRRGHPVPESLIGDARQAAPWRTPGLDRAWAALPDPLKARWIWWRLPEPPARRSALIDVLEPTPSDVPWHAPQETERLLAMMAPLHRRRLQTAVADKTRSVGALYRRTRPGPDGKPQQRVEIRFDGVAGCLRTPAGGSSRQTVMIVEDGRVRSRLISGRETARLMGLPDSYRLPARYGDVYHLTGDGVVVDVVAHLAEHLLAPLAGAAAGRIAA